MAFLLQKTKIKKSQKVSQDMLVILTDNSGMAKIKSIDVSEHFPGVSDTILIHLTPFRE